MTKANGQHKNTEAIDLCEQFLREYYRNDIGELAEKYPKDQQSLVIDWSDIFSFNPDLAWDVAEKPEKVRDYFEEALRLFDLPVDVGFDEAKVRFKNVTSDREMYVGEYETHFAEELIGVTGQLRQLSQSQPQLLYGRYECQRCGTVTEMPQQGSEIQEPHECSGCERQGPFRLKKDESEFQKHQLARIELPPEHADGTDQYIDAHFYGDVADSLKGNERINITGRLSMDVDNNDGRDIPWRFEGDHIEIEEGGFTDVDYSEYQDDIEEIAAKDDPVAYLGEQLAADLYKDEKMELVCEALICGMVGAARGGSERPDSHMFLVGDPGTAKSELLEAVHTVSPRSRYASGESVSGAGLTAAAERTDFGPGEWTVKAGLLPRTNDGVVCIDELDKIPDQDKAKLHSALEKQQIDFSKAGEEAHLPARTALMAAGNPKNGRFDQYQPVPEQLDLSPTMLSRFDLIYTMVDQPEKEHDENVAEAVIENWNTTSEETADKMGEIEIDLFQAYIAYARETVEPELTNSAKDLIAEKYVEIRSHAYSDDDEGVPVTARKIGAFMRRAEASARARMSEEITELDAQRAIQQVEQSLQDVGIDPETGEYDADVIETGQSKSQRERLKNIKGIITEIENEYDSGAPEDVVLERAEEAGISEGKAEHEIEKLKGKGEIYSPKSGHLRTS
jgi:replicative DNA helicase Mcm